MSRAPQAKNRAPAPIQITAEQLLREAKEQKLDVLPAPPKQFITDKEELLQYQQTKRKDFEDQIRRQRQNMGIWTRYALWEAVQKEFERARSVFERALDVDYRNQAVWLKYAEMEMKNKFVNHARNIWDRCVTLHPRVDNFWYKYSYMEEMVGAIDLARQVFERWMSWEPDDMAWAAYIKFEMRQSEVELARAIYERYISLLPTCRAYLKYARWEEKLHQRSFARNIYERALKELHPQERSEKLLLNFARFEERCKEFERARVIYQYAISQIVPDNQDDLSELKAEFIAFEKRHGSKEEIEDAIVTTRREQYESLIAEDQYNYDVWFDYIRLEEAESSSLASQRVRAVYDRAVANVPPIAEKRYWRRYIYLWINYAIYEELKERDIARARQVYKECLSIVPHKVFTFGKIWLMAAQLEVRQKDLPAARKILGQAIGMCGKENIFKGYIELELQLGEIERCRMIYMKYLEYMPHNCNAWKSFASLESNVGETARARAIYELAVNQLELDMPELLWKAFIDFEISEREYDNVRKLYERLLDKSSHVKVWISFALFEQEISLNNTEDENEYVDNESEQLARIIFTRGYDSLKQQGLKEERVMILEAWRDYENNLIERKLVSSNEHLTFVQEKLPRKIKKKRPIAGSDVLEEYYDYSFPDDEKKPVGMKLLENAMKWKMAAASSTLGDAMDIAQKSGRVDDEEIDLDDDMDADDSELGKRKLEE
eukprot:gene12813-17176_t